MGSTRPAWYCSHVPGAGYGGSAQLSEAPGHQWVSAAVTTIFLLNKEKRRAALSPQESWGHWAAPCKGQWDSLLPSSEAPGPGGGPSVHLPDPSMRCC